jgi:hypothetical protein
VGFLCAILEAPTVSPDRKTLKMKYARGAAPIVPQITAAEFAAALKTNGFRVVRAKIEDAIQLRPKRFTLDALPN